MARPTPVLRDLLATKQPGKQRRGDPKNLGPRQRTFEEAPRGQQRRASTNLQQDGNNPLIYLPHPFSPQFSEPFPGNVCYALATTCTLTALQEIAIRVFRTAHELAMKTVAIYSHEDRLSAHRYKARKLAHKTASYLLAYIRYRPTNRTKSAKG